jgi:hypothetical protein
METWKFVTIYALSLAAIVAGTKACHDNIYNKVDVQPEYTFVSEGNFLGIKEYTRYDSGHQELRITGPIFGQLNDFYEDTNGDGLVDIIKESSGWSGPRTANILTRAKDYNSNQELFSDADKEIQHYMDSYK